MRTGNDDKDEPPTLRHRSTNAVEEPSDAERRESLWVS